MPPLRAATEYPTVFRHLKRHSANLLTPMPWPSTSASSACFIGTRSTNSLVFRCGYSMSTGPRSRTSGAYGAVFGVFLAQKMAGKPYTVVGDGTQTRDFTFVTDVVDAFVKGGRVGSPWRCVQYRLGQHPQYQLPGKSAGRGRHQHPQTARRARLHFCRHHENTGCPWLAAQSKFRRRRANYASERRAMERSSRMGCGVHIRRNQRLVRLPGRRAR